MAAVLLAKKSSSVAARICFSPFMHPSKSLRIDKEVESMFESWMVEFEKVYKSIEEKEKRFAVFRDTLRGRISDPTRKRQPIKKQNKKKKQPPPLPAAAAAAGGGC
ncbi:hypothetical protein QVD17_16342 [Tagetes erecta]|uniref:Cathepsin propeptide inhibitor domain-containing protein n=1 Tax=Tagetes erecta TaxID=13708 RepID=A0AAD8P0L4_TARER|nr:hypothetical protein QVD17_16342 [Tagetes erecta]